ncbi:protein MpaA [Actimicrobium sp. GrIS 1.19]|uniref:M14 family zinc carboxypeptidase n=1 Tax=Actimicrobium sp. GrIS 1.19 TaxID=3071708 RepID=UPI002DFA0CF9|nr:protein MpaA [Actimicrobium sp. GrIS 1.19]
MLSSFTKVVVVTGLYVSANVFAATAPIRSGAVQSTAHQAGWCGKLAARLPGISAAACNASNLSPSGAVSTNGFPLLTRHIQGAPAKDGRKPLRVLLLGGIHGDELTASAIVFKWMQQVQTPLAQEFVWEVVPVVNPDGLLAEKPSRVNARGVDLNRNFPTPDWKKEAPRYWEKVTASDPRRFPGTGPLSEPETRWLNAEIARFKPNVIVSVHAPFGVLDFDGPAPEPEHFGRLQFNRVGVYPGSLGNYGGRNQNIPVITIELPNALAMPPEAEIQRIWQDMLSWMKHNVHRPESAPDRRNAARIASTR